MVGANTEIDMLQVCSYTGTTNYILWKTGSELLVSRKTADGSLLVYFYRSLYKIFDFRGEIFDQQTASPS